MCVLIIYISVIGAGLPPPGEKMLNRFTVRPLFNLYANMVIFRFGFDSRIVVLIYQFLVIFYFKFMDFKLT